MSTRPEPYPIAEDQLDAFVAVLLTDINALGLSRQMTRNFRRWTKEAPLQNNTILDILTVPKTTFISGAYRSIGADRVRRTNEKIQALFQAEGFDHPIAIPEAPDSRLFPRDLHGITDAATLKSKLQEIDGIIAFTNADPTASKPAAAAFAGAAAAALPTTSSAAISLLLAARNAAIKFPISVTPDSFKALMRDIEELGLPPALNAALLDPREGTPPITCIAHLLFVAREELRSAAFAHITDNDIETIQDTLNNFCHAQDLPLFDIAETKDKLYNYATFCRIKNTENLSEFLQANHLFIFNDRNEARQHLAKTGLSGTDAASATTCNPHKECPFTFPLPLTEGQIRILSIHLSSNQLARLQPKNEEVDPVTHLWHLLCVSAEELKRDFTLKPGNQDIDDKKISDIEKNISACLREHGLDVSFSIPATEDDITIPKEFRLINRQDHLIRTLTNGGWARIEPEACPDIARYWPQTGQIPANTPDPDLAGPASKFRLAAAAADAMADGPRFIRTKRMAGGNQKKRARNVKRGGGGQFSRRRAPGRNGP